MTCGKDDDSNEEIFGMINELKKYVKDSVEPIKKDTERIENYNMDIKNDMKKLIDYNSKLIEEIKTLKEEVKQLNDISGINSDKLNAQGDEIFGESRKMTDILNDENF